MLLLVDLWIEGANVMNEFVLPEEVLKNIGMMRNDAICKCVYNNYSKNVKCSFKLSVLACRAFRKGEDLFNTEFISRYAKEINNSNYEEMLYVINNKIEEIEKQFYIEYAEDIELLPKVHKNNKEILSSFICDCVKSGFKVKGEIVYNILTSENFKDMEVSEHVS